MNVSNNISAIILAGGHSTRMGTDKGFLLWNGKPFIQHIIDAVEPLVQEIIIVSDNPSYDDFNMERIEDVISNAGPLAGIYSGLKYSKHKRNIVLSCDIPRINTTILKKLFVGDNDIDIVQLKSMGRDMPLIAIYDKSCLNTFENLLEQGERKLRFAVSHCKVRTIELNNEESFFTTNFNTQEQFKSIDNGNNH